MAIYLHSMGLLDPSFIIEHNLHNPSTTKDLLSVSIYIHLGTACENQPNDTIVLLDSRTHQTSTYLSKKPLLHVISSKCRRLRSHPSYSVRGSTCTFTTHRSARDSNPLKPHPSHVSSHRTSHEIHLKETILQSIHSYSRHSKPYVN